MSTPLPQTLGNLSLVETVLRIRDTVPAFGKRVGGSSEFLEELIADDSITRPYCWIVPMAEYGDEINQDEGTQLRHSLFAFIVVVDNTMQKGHGLGGQAPRVHDSIGPLQDTIEQSLLTWEPESINLDSPIEWRQRLLLGMDNTEAHYQLEFEMAFVRFSPYYFPKGIREAIIAESEGTVTGAREIKEIAIRYNVDENAVRRSVEDGYFAIPTGTAPAPEEVAAALGEASILNVEDAEEETDIQQIETCPTPAPADSEHGITTTITKP